MFISIYTGAGGKESLIFAKETMELYKKIAQKSKLSIRSISELECVIADTSAYKLFQHENGVHRVQRVPKTDGKRVHTSTIRVSVMPDNLKEKVNIIRSDLRIDTYRSSGAGGQHVNTTDSAVRITHIPTGIVATDQSGRSQVENKEKAMKKLTSMLSSSLHKTSNDASKKEKKEKVGSGERSEAIRTYNWRSDRITCKILGKDLHGIDRWFKGPGWFNWRSQMSN